MRTGLAAFAVTVLFFSHVRLNATPPATKVLEVTQKNAHLLDQLEKYPDLEVLKIACIEKLRSLPDSIGNLTKLKELIIDNGNGCAMNPLLPGSIGKLRSLEKLVLYGAQDPRGVGKKRGQEPAERHKFPDSMSQLKNLTYLDLGRNGLEQIPEFVKDLPNLKELGFAWNMKLKNIPAFLVDLRELTTLKLDSDGLTDLPDFLKRLPKLSRITLGNNCAITQSQVKMQDLRKRFPKITFDFEDEYDCPSN
jgi:Leucine-rich repeat (LRR) protein